MTNFDIFLSEAKFASFAEVAVSAEKIYQIDPATCIITKSVIQKSLDETQLLFDSLMQEYFG